MIGSYFAAAWAGWAARAAGCPATVTRSPSFRKPAPSTTTRTPALTPLTAVWVSVRDRTVTSWKWAEASLFSPNTPALLFRYRRARVGTVVAGWAPALIWARANMPGRNWLPGDSEMRARPRRV